MSKQDGAMGRILPFPAPEPTKPDSGKKERPAPESPARRPSIKDWPDGERPRERLINRGSAALSDAELLAILLRTGEGAGKGSALDHARSILGRFGGVTGIARATPSELCKLPGVGPAKACTIAAGFALAERALSQSASPRVGFGCSEDVYRFMGPRLARKRAEEFWVLLLDAKNKLLREEQVSLGSLVSTNVHPREVFGAAVRESAASVILVHNHPSGDPTPSKADREVTARLVEAARLLGVRVLDHIVIGHKRWESFADKGWL